MEKTSRPFPLFLLLPPGLGGDKSGPIRVVGFLWGKPGGRSPSPPPLFNILLQGWSSERSLPCTKNLDGDKAFVSFFLPLGRTTKVEATKYKRVGTERKGEQKNHTKEPHAPRLQRHSPCPEVLAWGQKREASNARRGIRQKPVNKNIVCSTRQSYKGWLYPIVVILPLPGEKGGDRQKHFFDPLRNSYGWRSLVGCSPWGR